MYALLPKDRKSRIRHRGRSTEAPKEFVDNLLSAIIGVELTITGLEGKWKVSQNRSARDRQGVIEGLRNLDSSDAQRMADLMDSMVPIPPSREPAP